MRALVVDDDDDTVEVLSEFLEMKGVTVVGKAYNGKEAVEAFQELSPDVVMLDIMMPSYDGFYAIDELRKIDPDVKIITITADLSMKTKRKLKELKISPVLFKPYDVNTVMDIIHSIEDGQTIFLSY